MTRCKQLQATTWASCATLAAASTRCLCHTWMAPSHRSANPRVGLLSEYGARPHPASFVPVVGHARSLESTRITRTAPRQQPPRITAKPSRLSFAVSALSFRPLHRPPPCHLASTHAPPPLPPSFAAPDSDVFCYLPRIYPTPSRPRLAPWMEAQARLRMRRESTRWMWWRWMLVRMLQKTVDQS